MKTIVVGTDFSFAAAKASVRAIRIAATFGASIRFVHATDATDERERDSLERRLIAEATTFAEQVGDWVPEVTVRVSAQRPAEAILHEAADCDADLIVIGSHGTPRFRDVIFGTTGTHVVRHGDRPVLIVGSDPFESYARVLIAVAESSSADDIFGAAVDLSPDAEMIAVHAFYPPLRVSIAGAARLESERTRIRTEMERRLGEARERRAGGQVTADNHVVVEDGDALSVMMETAETLAPDLIAMGTRRGTTYLGSNAVDTMFWAGSDLLIVPERAHEVAEPPEPVSSPANPPLP